MYIKKLINLDNKEICLINKPKKICKTKVCRSRTFHKRHVDIIVRVKEKDDMELAARELERAVDKINRSLNKKFSYTIFGEYFIIP